MSQKLDGRFVDQQNFKNKIINGSFAVNQRVVSGTVVLAADEYGHDRFKGGASGCTYTFATAANVTTLTISAGSLIQVVEGLMLQSGVYTLSWSGTAQGQIDAGGYGDSGVEGTLVGGTDATIEFGTGTLTQVQLEEGSVATEFEQRPLSVEEMLCCRYYHATTTSIVGYLSPPSTSSLSRRYIYVFPTEMRTIPTATYSVSGGTSTVQFVNTKTVEIYSDIDDTTTAVNWSSLKLDAEL